MPQAPAFIFVNSMSDITYWQDDWVARVLGRMAEASKHTFLLLSKQADAYDRFQLAGANVWFGMTATNESTLHQALRLRYANEKRRVFVSVEPLHGSVGAVYAFDWVIVGAETGNRKGRVVPEREWIQSIVDVCTRMNTPLWMKNNLGLYWPGELIQQRPGSR